jgi:arsenate reductase-like glutaredoxin family protein
VYAEKFRIAIYNLGREYAVEASIVEKISREEFKSFAKTCKKMFMDLVHDAPYTFRIVFKNYQEALSTAAELAKLLGEETFYNGEKKTLTYVPVVKGGVNIRQHKGNR